MDVRAVESAIAEIRNGIDSAVYVSGGARSSLADVASVADLVRSSGRPGRVYFGTDTCEHALPTPAALASALRTTGRAGIPLTLVTPPCTDAGLSGIDALLAGLDAGSEVVFNDWGVFRLLAERPCRPVFGRVLNSSVRDPFIPFSRYSPRALALFQATMAHTHEMQAFLRARGVARVELDNVVQGVARLPSGSLPASIYWPHVLVAISRFCGDAIATACRGACPTRTLAGDGREMLVCGTGSYYEQPRLPDRLDEIPVDRVVFQPSIGDLSDPRCLPDETLRGGDGRAVSCVPRGKPTGR